MLPTLCESLLETLSSISSRYQRVFKKYSSDYRISKMFAINGSGVRNIHPGWLKLAKSTKACGCGVSQPHT